ncbi:hypothetical protein Emtol_2217 [Emticicia oligotrophica DSM 17448]|uniref:Uncharacterized protein n=1 Tax=Emticicia oligotrophica (strain DSM 17448 / CIP 109782 / MTCC 6937 / GPTSA100-15) TaxID=929562 RepID=A0ABM5N1Z5_EMTOG|nr:MULTISPECIES: hypothetical protein [Emticicia]AFK03355.1 hypothetical protein Emtol_2217 [Emticicia oligotrophica DSM 17448]
MKKLSLIIVLFVMGLSFNTFAQTAAAAAPVTDFYVGKWEVTILGTPQGDAKFVATITRKDGKLVGEMTNPAEPTAAANPMTNVEEADGKMTIYFSASGYDLNIPFEKVDDNNLKGQLMGMFDAKAVRVK